MSERNFPGVRVPDAGNPLSEQFRQSAAQNVTQNIAAMRNQKELARDGQQADEAPPSDTSSPRDSVRLGPTGRTDAPPPHHADTASLSTPQNNANPPDGPHERSLGDGAASSRQGLEGGIMGGGGLDDALASGALLSAAGGGGLLDDTAPSVRRQRNEEAKRLAREGVPPEILEASGEIVKGQMHPVRGPRTNLREMKEVPEAAAHETAPADFAAEMDIADTAAAAPLLLDEGEPSA